METDIKQIIKRKIARQIAQYADASQQICALEQSPVLHKLYQVQAQAYQALRLLAHYHYKYLFTTNKVQRIQHKEMQIDIGYQNLKPSLKKPNTRIWNDIAHDIYQIDPQLVTLSPNIDDILSLSPQDKRYQALQALGITQTQDTSFFVTIL